MGGAPAWRWLAELAVLSDEPLDTGVRPREGPETSLRLGAARVDDRVPIPTALEGADSRTERRAGKKRRSERRERIERPERSVEVFIVDCDRVVLTPAPVFSASSSSLQGSLGLAMAVSSAHSSSSSRPLSSSLEARTNTGHRTGLDWTGRKLGGGLSTPGHRTKPRALRNRKHKIRVKRKRMREKH